jgi:hypothetical protein
LRDEKSRSRAAEGPSSRFASGDQSAAAADRDASWRGVDGNDRAFGCSAQLHFDGPCRRIGDKPPRSVEVRQSGGGAAIPGVEGKAIGTNASASRNTHGADHGAARRVGEEYRLDGGPGAHDAILHKKTDWKSLNAGEREEIGVDCCDWPEPRRKIAKEG